MAIMVELKTVLSVVGLLCILFSALKSVNQYTRQLADIQGMRKVCFILLLYLSLYDFYSVKIQPRACSLPLSWTVVEYHSPSHWANVTSRMLHKKYNIRVQY